MEYYEFYLNPPPKPKLSRLFKKNKKYRLIYAPGKTQEVLGRGSYKFCKYREKVCKDSGNYPSRHLKIIPDVGY